MLLRLSFLKVLEAGDVAELLHQVFFLGHALDHHLVVGFPGLRFVLHAVGSVARSCRVILIVVPVVPSRLSFLHALVAGQTVSAVLRDEAGAVVVLLPVEDGAAAVALGQLAAARLPMLVEFGVADAVGGVVVPLLPLFGGDDLPLLLLLLNCLRFVGEMPRGFLSRHRHHYTLGSHTVLRASLGFASFFACADDAQSASERPPGATSAWLRGQPRAKTACSKLTERFKSS